MNKDGTGNSGTALNLTETLLRHAFINGKSAAGAARYLNVSYSTLKKYAKLYIDEESGKTLFELYKNPAGVGLKKNFVRSNPMYYIQEVIDGQHPYIKPSTVKDLFLKNAMIKSECCNCGFSEARITDYKLPVILDFIDGNRKNFALDNLRLYCYNCFFLLIGNLHSAKIQKYDWQQSE